MDVFSFVTAGHRFTRSSMWYGGDWVALIRERKREKSERRAEMNKGREKK